MKNYITYFTLDEQQWLSANPTIKDDLFEEVDDISNVNPLDNGEPDMMPQAIAIRAVKLLIKIVNNNLLEGPYNEEHFRIVKIYFPNFNTTTDVFWDNFSEICADKNDEGEFLKEVKYVNATAALALMVEGENNQFQPHENIFNMNGNSMVYINGKGVNSYYSQ